MEYNMPNPINIEYIIKNTGRGDAKKFQILYYDEEKKEIIKNIKEFKQVDNEALNIYYKTVKECFIEYLPNYKLDNFKNNFKAEKIIINDNYYAFFEKSDKYRYYFEFIILDTKDNKLYSIYSGACRSI